MLLCIQLDGAALAVKVALATGRLSADDRTVTVAELQAYFKAVRWPLPSLKEVLIERLQVLAGRVCAGAREGKHVCGRETKRWGQVEVRRPGGGGMHEC